jgi:hypothetical protein
MFIEVKWQFPGDYLFQIKLRRLETTNKKEMFPAKMQNKSVYRNEGKHYHKNYHKN